MFGWGKKKEVVEIDPNAKFDGKNISSEDIQNAKSLDDEYFEKNYENFSSCEVFGNKMKLYRKQKEVYIRKLFDLLKKVPKFFFSKK